MRSYPEWRIRENVGNDPLQNELILILHHVGDIEESLKKRDIRYALEGLKDIRESVQRLSSMLPSNQSKEISRTAD